jgi:GTP-binding protein LepA
MAAGHTQANLRNFCIIAHIDHGKSTLADRLLEHTRAITPREMVAQVLDSMDLERERGITIKMQAVRLSYQAADGREYILNLIDTPGHVDFNYEVSRSLAACEGALLVVDAVQGIEAQTLAHAYLAIEHDLEIVPVINKIDLPGADPEKVKKEIEDLIGLEASEAILTSAKTGLGTAAVLEAIVQRIPPPQGDPEVPLRALIFDSHFDSYRGAISYIRVMEGRVFKGDMIKMMSSGKLFEVNELGVFTPSMRPVPALKAGEVGYLTASIKNVGDTQVGDTITTAKLPAATPLAGYRQVKPVVFCGLYPVDSSDYENLRDAMEKLKLNDASFFFEPETSSALGFGFRCGFLGLLHLEVIQERLEREHHLDLVTTAPSVIYRITKTDGEVVYIDNPVNLPPLGSIRQMEEPFALVNIMVPSTYVGAIMELAQEKRGVYLRMEYASENRVILVYELPLAEIIYNFFDQLKSRSRGYASFDYEIKGYQLAQLVKLDILVNGEVVDALSTIVHHAQAARHGRAIAEKLKELIPRQLFNVPIQAAVGGKIIARETVREVRKNVLEKCYGGDVTRKRKLLEKQKEGKKRMKQVGNVEIPQEAFMAVLRIDR